MPGHSMLSLTVGKLTLALCLETACYHWQWADSHWHYAYGQHAITDSGQTHTGTMPTDSMLSLTVGKLTLALCLRTACYHWQWADSHWHYAYRQHAITDSGQTHTGTMPGDSMLSLTVGRLTLALCLQTAWYHWQWADSHWHYAWRLHAITDSRQTHTGTMPTDSMLSLTVGRLTLALCLETACYHWQWANSHWHYAWRQHAITDSGQTHTGTMPTDSMLSLTVGRLTLALCLQTTCYYWQ